MDEELKTLSEEVFKRTGWHGVDHALANLIPSYTSDYLLEKLPRKLELDGYHFSGDTENNIFHLELDSWADGDMEWSFYYSNGGETEFYSPADTPLKALLKLVIALDNANQLPHEEKE